MATATKATAAAAVVLVAAGLLWFGGAWPGTGTDGPSLREAAARPSSTVAAPLPVAPEVVAKEEPPAAPASPTAALNQYGVPKDPVPAVIAGRVVTESGAPIPYARVAVRILEAEVTARSGNDGAFRVDLTLPTGYGNGWNRTPGRPLTFALGLVASARGRESVARSLNLELRKDCGMSLGDLVLRPGGSVAGRVLDADGAPVAAAWVGIEDTDHASAPVEDKLLWPRETLTTGVPTHSDVTGGFLLEGIPVGPVRLWAGKDRFRAGRSRLVEVDAGEEIAGVEVEVEAQRPEDRIEGRVVAPDGSKVEYPHLFAQAEAPGRRNTVKVNWDPEAGKDGEFSLPVHYAADYYILAQDQYERWGAAFAGPVRPGDRSVVLEFPEARKVTLRVRSRAGEPVVSWRADLSHATVPFGYSFWGVKPGEHPGGDAEFLAPGFPFKVEVTAEGFAVAELGPFDPAALHDAMDCVLNPLTRAGGRVLSGGCPVAGARVLAQIVVSKGSKCVRDDLPCRWYPDEEASAATDAAGAFALPLQFRKEVVLRAEADGFAPVEIGPLDFDPVRGLEGLEILLGRGGTLEGRVIMDEGLSPDGTIVVVHRGDGRPRSLRVAKDGVFRFEGLIPGPWILARHPREVPAEYMTSYSPGSSEFRWNCVVEEGRRTTRDLDLRDVAGPVLRGRFSPAAPVESAGWTAALIPAGGSPFGQPVAGPATLGANGTFELRPPVPGPYLLRLSDPDGSIRVFDAAEVPEGEASWHLDLAFGRVEGCVDARSAWALLWLGEGERCAFAEARPGPDREFVVPLFPAGRVRVIGFAGELPLDDPANFTGAWRDRKPWREIDVPAGGTARVE